MQENVSENDRDRNLKKFGRKGAKIAKKGAFDMKDIIKKYGFYFTGTYLCVYFTTLSSFFIAIDSGWFDPTVIIDFHPFASGGESEAAASAAQTAADLKEEEENVRSMAHMAGQLLEKWEFTAPYAATVQQSPKLANLAVAWLCTKLVEPLRLMVAVPLTPRIARILGRKDGSVESEENRQEEEQQQREK
eukprot:CAMPEP_0172506448 /NCGR_PEP_ID=MMETSP1066-20121228/195215_1 /TAXON_ID=671091 /ORGANISM="Coscinodiscus wailesii, Strain CCMP2513" /LENGTH=189 /DNA_ID=CAMNT_0013283491 /DNA_START=363 /DNA_END=932 /DNA_ORIENTATION=+